MKNVFQNNSTSVHKPILSIIFLSWCKGKLDFFYDGQTNIARADTTHWWARALVHERRFSGATETWHIISAWY